MLNLEHVLKQQPCLFFHIQLSSRFLVHMLPQIFSAKWRNPTTTLVSALNFIVFLVFDFFDAFLCVVYRYIDELFEGQEASSCYCTDKEEQQARRNGDGEEGEEPSLSETLYERKNVFRKMGFLGFAKKWRKSKSANPGKVKNLKNRWSDCGCQSCVSWTNDAAQKLHFVIGEPEPSSQALTDEDCREKPPENVIFLHGFLCSSSFWTETVFPNLSEHGKRNYRLFAVDLLGFGRSPKPRDCFYTLKDHLEMIEKSVIYPFQLNSFHLVAHSMGCLIAIALAAKHPELVKSVTLVAPPYFPSKDGDSLRVLEKLAARKLWPPFVFGTSFMSWYEHLGRCVCFLVCRHHRTWETIAKLLTRRRNLHFMTVDFTRHTHHSAWHTMHNVICGGAKLMEGYLQVLSKAGVKVCVIHGDRDNVVPIECSNNIQMAAPDAQVNIVKNTTHNSVIFGRKRDFTRHVEHIWESNSGRRTYDKCS